MLSPPALAIVLAAFFGTQEAPVPACTLRDVTALPVTVGGRELYVEPSALSRSTAGVFIMGEPVLLTNPTERAFVNGRAAVGALIGSNGRATLIPAPAGSSGIRRPRVLHEPGRGWHVFWLPELTPRDARPDSATLTYARFDGRRWTVPKSLGTVGIVMTGPVGISHPVLAGGRVMIALVDGRTMQDRRVLLFRSNGRGGWDRTVVKGPVPAAYATLTRAGKRLLIAYSGRDSAFNPTLFFTRSGDNGATWSAPSAIVRTSTSQPNVMATDDALVTAWMNLGSENGTEILLAHSADGGRSWSSPILAGQGNSIMTDYSLSSFGGRGFLMLRLTRNADAPARISIGWGRDTVIHWHDLASNPESFLPLVTASSNGTAYMAWGESVQRGGEPSPRLMLSKVRFSCPRRTTTSQPISNRR